MCWFHNVKYSLWTFKVFSISFFSGFCLNFKRKVIQKRSIGIGFFLCGQNKTKKKLFHWELVGQFLFQQNGEFFYFQYKHRSRKLHKSIQTLNIRIRNFICEKKKKCFSLFFFIVKEKLDFQFTSFFFTHTHTQFYLHSHPSINPWYQFLRELKSPSNWLPSIFAFFCFFCPCVCMFFFIYKFFRFC